MSFLSNAHTHTTFSDGKHTPAEMLAAAKQLGFVSLGFSCHGYQGFDFDYSMTKEAQREYQAEIRRLQAQSLADKTLPRVWLGIEEDGLTPQDWREQNRRELDYVVVSSHYITRDFEGEPVYVDGLPERLRHYTNQVFDGDMMAMVQQYFDLHVQALLSMPVSIIGHFDLVRIYAKSHNLFDEHCKEYRRIALCALEKAFPCGGLLEINTGAIARGKREDPYPTPELLSAWHDMGGRITITSDCHDAKNLDFFFPEAVQLAKACGFKTAFRLGTGNQLFEEVVL